MDENIESQFISKWPKGNTYGSRKRKLVITEAQAWAIILKIEDKLNNAQIARLVSDKYDPITPQSVGRWWTKPHIKREIKRHQERYNEELMPAIILEMNEGREAGVKEMKSRISSPTSSLSEITGATKFFSAEVDKAKTEIIEEDDNAKAKETTDNILQHLSPSGKKKLAEHYAFGTEIELTEDDIIGDIQEAEVIEDEQQDRSIAAGDHQESGP